MRSRMATVGTALVVLLVAAVGGGAGASAAPSTTTPPPTSMAALGDSFTVGFATGAADCAGFVACPQYSWSTGTAVDSHYQRLVALEPGLAGNAVNAAVPGAPMASLVGQATTVAPTQPDYVTVLLGGGDVCFGTTPTATFAAQFRAGMDALFAASPDTKVLVASLWDFESLRSAVLAADPSATFPFCGAFFNAPVATRAAIMAQVEAYNDALATECATYANCRFDGGALFAHQWSAAEVGPVDHFHPSVAGQEMIADVLWDAGYEWGTPATTPTSKDQCKKGGWQSFTDAAGVPFRNQGQCVAFTNHTA